jgi:hypothetical protein
LTYQFCGATLDLRDVVSESGWREALRIKDMTEIHFSNSTCQVEVVIIVCAVWLQPNLEMGQMAA